MRLNEVVALAKRKFWSQETHKVGNYTRPYQDVSAVGDAVDEAASSLEVAAALCVEVGERRDINIAKITLDGANEAGSVLEYLQFLLECVVTELVIGDKDIVAEDKRRQNKYKG